MRGGPSIIGRARRLRRDTTDAERMLWAELRHDQLGWRFRRQHPMLPYIVDFACIGSHPENAPTLAVPPRAGEGMNGG